MLKCNGWDITTVESMGNKLDGYGAVATALATQSGTQCGFCSPGWAAAMFALLQENPNPTEEEVRFGMAGNLCRCTGYQNIVKSILAAASEMQAAKEAAE